MLLASRSGCDSLLTFGVSHRLQVCVLCQWGSYAGSWPLQLKAHLWPARLLLHLCLCVEGHGCECTHSF